MLVGDVNLIPIVLQIIGDVHDDIVSPIGFQKRSRE